ncbi:MAG: phosphate/phosphite/phosphonate ABC transporter substrate-binding protein [Bacteroidetes bacterium]|nr:MAG: phosphate/phosphite/phosphonate ABC transporter substrate-binding protein [Bacteroidota bacterium]
MRFFFLALISTIFVSCSNIDNGEIIVDFSDTMSSDMQDVDNGEKAVYVAIASMTSPKETYTYYHDLVDYISKKIDRPIYIRQKETYVEVNEMLEKSEVDFAFICSGAYAEESLNGKTKLMVVPVVNERTTYQAYIITHKDSKINKFSDFKNKSFAFTDPLSTTGRLYPLSKLNRLGETESDFFLKTVYTYGHDISIQMVNRGVIDGASVHSLIYEYTAMHYPERLENTKVIVSSGGFGMPPVVTPSSLDNDSFDEIRDVFINMNNDSIGRVIIDHLNIDRFDIVGDTLYKSVIKLKEESENAEQ